MISNKTLFIGIFSLCFAGFATAQDQKSGEIKDAEFIIQKDRLITLPAASRNFEKIPPVPKAKPLTSMQYQFKDFAFPVPGISTDVRPFNLAFKPLEKQTYPLYMKLGYGNYNTPYGELWYNSLNSDLYTYGVHAKHINYMNGPVDQQNSAENHTNIALNGQYFGRTSVIKGNIFFDRDQYHFYGYTPIPATEILAEDIRQRFVNFGGQVGIENLDKMDAFTYSATLGARFFQDFYEATENEITITGGLAYQPQTNFKVGLDIGTYLTSPRDLNVNVNRNLFRGTPYLTLGQPDQLYFKGGVNVVQENDDFVGKESDLHIYPTLLLSYQIIKELAVEIALDGDMERNTLLSFVNMNPWMRNDLNLLNTNKLYEASAKVNGRLAGDFNFEVGFSYAERTNEAFMANAASDSTRFDLIYESGFSRTSNVFVGFHYDKNDIYKVGLRADMYRYDLENLQEAYHRPQYSIKVYNTVKPLAKWTFQGDVTFMGGIDALNLESGFKTRLDPFIDLNFRTDFQMTPRVGLFLNLDNALGREYQRYLNYDTRGFQILGGLSFKL